MSSPSYLEALRHLEALQDDLTTDGGMSRLWAMPLDELLTLGDEIQQHLTQGNLTDPADDDIEGRALSVALRFAWEWICDVRETRKAQQRQTATSK